MATLIQLRRGLAANWTSSNPTLAQGEAGLELDTGRWKWGDGSTTWNLLPYIGVLPATGTAGAPVAGEWDTDTAAIDSTGRLWVCTAGGTPGTWVLPTEALIGALLATNNLSDLANAGTARANLGLGSAATHAATDFDSAGAAAAEAARAEAAEAALIPLAQKGAASGVATLDAGGKIPTSELPAITMNTVWPGVGSQAAMLALAAEPGDVAVRTDISANFMLAALPAATLANWAQLADLASPVTSVAGKTGAVSLAEGDVSGLVVDLAAKAPLASPVLTGSPTAPTAAALDSSTKVATTAYADVATAVEKSRALAAEAAAIATAEAASDPAGSATTALATATGRAVAFAIVFGS